uniref:CD209 antigen-like n=1 Tax=Ciona intestinalis TaxID=7719 RepID=UPI000521209E|nr:CD209 antigen-like [Ciona intestinalis]|eukprot:XP_009859261.1 CD209 antigen-like [Ciona intestinalis]
MHFSRKSESVSYLTRSEEIPAPMEKEETLNPQPRRFMRETIIVVIAIVAVCSIIVVPVYYISTVAKDFANVTDNTTMLNFSLPRNADGGSASETMQPKDDKDKKHAEYVADILDIKEYINKLKNETNQKFKNLERAFLHHIATLQWLEDRISAMEIKVNTDGNTLVTLADALNNSKSQNNRISQHFDELSWNVTQLNDSNSQLGSDVQFLSQELARLSNLPNITLEATKQYQQTLNRSLLGVYSIVESQNHFLMIEVKSKINKTAQKVLDQASNQCDAKLEEEHTRLQTFIRTSTNAEADTRAHAHQQMLVIVARNKALAEQTAYHIRNSVSVLQARASRTDSAISSISNTTNFLTQRLSEKLDIGWVSASNGYAYKVLQALFPSWLAARSACLALSSDLAIEGPRNNFSNFFSEYLVKPLDKNVWIGLTDSLSEGTWQWTDGRKLTQYEANWAAGQPNDWGPGQDCAELRAATGKWNDLKCASFQTSMQNYALCEKGMP